MGPPLFSNLNNNYIYERATEGYIHKEHISVSELYVHIYTNAHNTPLKECRQGSFGEPSTYKKTGFYTLRT